MHVHKTQLLKVLKNLTKYDKLKKPNASRGNKEIVLVAQKETEVAESSTADTDTCELAKESMSSRMAEQQETLSVETKPASSLFVSLGKAL